MNTHEFESRAMGGGWRWLCGVAFGCGLLTWTTIASAQNFAIDWFTVDGGGGISTGGVYAVTGTIGQPNAGAMQGGAFSLQGGFWGIIALQTPGAPTLRIYHANGIVAVAWAKPAEGWVLEGTNAMPATVIPWPRVALPYQTNATDIFITNGMPAGNAFYRLHKP